MVGPTCLEPFRRVERVFAVIFLLLSSDGGICNCLAKIILPSHVESFGKVEMDFRS
jgi:hypothetical protein